MVSLIIYIITSTILFGLPKSAVAISLGYRTSLFQMFERQDVEGSDTIVDYKAPKDEIKLVRKRILDTTKEGTSPQSVETQNIRSLEASYLDFFW